MVCFDNLEDSGQDFNSKTVYYKEMYDRRVRVIIRSCEYCSSEFTAVLKRVKNGNGRHCSVLCANRNQTEGRKGEDHMAYKGKSDYLESKIESSSCSREGCEEDRNEALCFHHVSADEKEENVSLMAISGDYSLDDLKEEISKCIVLCRNCHRIKHSNEPKSPSPVPSYEPEYDKYERHEGYFDGLEIYIKIDDKYNRSRVLYDCEYCGQEFFTRVDKLKKGKGKFHSYRCSVRSKILNDGTKKGYIRKLKTLGCCSNEDCNEDRNRCLEFHHINKDDKEGIISAMIEDGSSLQELKTEANKCELICSNCHQLKHSG